MKTKTPEQMFFEHIEAAIKQYEKEKLSQKIIEALASKKLKVGAVVKLSTSAILSKQNRRLFTNSLACFVK
jgi:hypothetical protein